MKKIITTFVMLLCLISSAKAMSDSRIRESARFLSDRMAYELQLTTMQYEDCYEINYDFLYSINSIMDDVVYGYSDAIEAYYDYLDWRNDDISMVLNRSQFERFMALEYFYRPIYTSGRNWLLRIYQIYTNHSYFYFGVPTIYHTYHGIHSRHHHSAGFYGVRYHHDHYYDHHVHHIHGSQHFDNHRRADFGDRYHHRDNGHLRRPEHRREPAPRINNRREHRDNHGVSQERHDRNHGVERHDNRREQHNQGSSSNHREQHNQGSSNNHREQHGQGSSSNRREQHGLGSSSNRREQHGQGSSNHREHGPVAQQQSHRSSVTPQRVHQTASSSSAVRSSSAGHSRSNGASSTRPSGSTRQSSGRSSHSGGSHSRSEGRGHNR